MPTIQHTSFLWPLQQWGEHHPVARKIGVIAASIFCIAALAWVPIKCIGPSPAIQALSNTLVITEAKQGEDTYRAGGSTLLTAICQCAQSLFLLSLFPISLPGQLGIALLPIPIAVLKNRFATTAPIYNHLGNLYQLASAVAAVALIVLGQPVVGSVAVSVLGIKWLQREGVFSSETRTFLRRSARPLATVAALFAFPWLQRWGAALSIFSYFRPQRPLIEPSPIRDNPLTASQLREWLQMPNPLQQFRLAPGCVLHNPMPFVPEIDIGYLVSQCKQIDWRQHAQALEAYVLAHDNFQRFLEENPNQVLPPEEFAQRGLEQLVRVVKQQCIKEGDISDYSVIHTYLKSLTQHLQREDVTEEAKVILLLNLGVVGRECGSGQFEAAESLFKQILMASKTQLSLKDKIFLFLQNERYHWVSQEYRRSLLHSVFQFFSHEDTVHCYHFFTKLYSYDQLGLGRYAAHNDEAAQTGSVLKRVCASMTFSDIEKRFWRDHSLEALMPKLMQSIELDHIPKTEVIQFWAQQQELPLEMDKRLDSNWVLLMLFQMGIVERERPPLL